MTKKKLAESLVKQCQSEKYRTVINDVIEWLEQKEPTWELLEPVDKKKVVWDLLERAK